MKRLIFLCGVAGMLLAGCARDTERDKPSEVGEPNFRRRPPLDVPPMASRNFSVEFAGGKRALVLALGNGATYMGLYVYDAEGNCIAWDDEGNAATCDDLCVAWTPQQTAIYTVEVRNAGFVSNKCRVLMR